MSEESDCFSPENDLERLHESHCCKANKLKCADPLEQKGDWVFKNRYNDLELILLYFSIHFFAYSAWAEKPLNFY